MIHTMSNQAAAGNRYTVEIAGEPLYLEGTVDFDRARYVADSLTRDAMGAATGEVRDLRSGKDGGTIVYPVGGVS